MHFKQSANHSTNWKLEVSTVTTPNMWCGEETHNKICFVPNTGILPCSCEILQQILRCVKLVAGLQCRCLASVLQPQATTSSPLSPPCLSEVEEVLASPPCLSPPPASPPASATASNGLQPLHLAAPRRHSASVAAQCQWGNFRP